MFKKSILAVALCATLLHAQKVESVTINGTKDVDKIKKFIDIQRGDEFSAQKVEAAKQIIVQALSSKGFNDSVVTSSVKNRTDGAAITFDVTEGEKITLRKINFVGNSALSSSILKSNMSNHELESFGWFPGRNSGEADMVQLKYDSQRIREEYLKRGYLDAKVSEPSVDIDQANHSAVATFNITEGLPYTVSSVGISLGGPQGVDEQAVKSELQLTAGEKFNVKYLRSDMKMITDKIGEHGYAYVKVRPDVQKAGAQQVAVVYQALPGAQVKIGNISVKGNNKTKERVVRRYMYEAPGDMYNSTDIKDSKKALMRTGFFDKVKIVKKQTGGDAVDLEVDVDEAKTGAFTAGGGYSSRDGFSLNFGVSDKNFVGSGIEVGTDLVYGKDNKSINLHFTDPRIFDTKNSLSGSVFYRDKYIRDYRDGEDGDRYEGLKSRGGYLSLGRELARNWHGSLGVSYTKVDYQNINTNYREFRVDDPALRDYVKKSLLASLKYNSTNRYYNPSEGMYAKLNLEYAGGCSNTDSECVKFTRGDFRFAAFYGLEDKYDKDVIFRYKFKAGQISHDDKKLVPVAERYTLGGSSRGIRGFRPGTIDPDYGGFKMAVNSIEVNIPSYVTEAMRFTAFYDYGMVGIDNFDEVKKQSAGVQIEWRSPMGPVEFIFAKPIDKMEEDEESVFEFGMTTSF